MPDKIVTGEYADNILGVSSGLPAKKCITGIELDNALELMPKGNAITSEQYHNLYDTLITPRKSENMFCLVENRMASQILISSGYGEIEILENMYGGYFCIPNATGNRGLTMYLSQDTDPIIYRYAPRSDGGFDRKDFTSAKYKNTVNLPDPYVIAYAVDFNKDYDLNGFGYFYFVSC